MAAPASASAGGTWRTPSAAADDAGSARARAAVAMAVRVIMIVSSPVEDHAEPAADAGVRGAAALPRHARGGLHPRPRPPADLGGEAHAELVAAGLIGDADR